MDEDKLKAEKVAAAKKRVCLVTSCSFSGDILVLTVSVAMDITARANEEG